VNKDKLEARKLSDLMMGNQIKLRLAYILKSIMEPKTYKKIKSRGIMIMELLLLKLKRQHRHHRCLMLEELQLKQIEKIIA
jgi:hypothetical protein